MYLKDIVKGGIRERFEHLRRMGIKTVMITGDNPLTAAAIAAEAGVDGRTDLAVSTANAASVAAGSVTGSHSPSASSVVVAAPRRTTAWYSLSAPTR